MRPESNSLIRDPLCSCVLDAHSMTLSLPQLMARLLLGNADDVVFSRVRAEQRSHWWRFLVRSGAHVLHELEVEPGNVIGAADDLEAAIRRVLLESTGGEEPWFLYHDDPRRPAFLQPPTPDGEAPELSYKENSLSFLTTALGSKNFERKIDVLRELDPEQTVYALVEFQGGAIFGGRGNYGSQLMGSGSGKGSGTPFMGVRLPGGDCETYRHDVGVLLSRWEETRTALQLKGHVWALWTVPWDGETSLPARELTPAFIPLARMVRLGPPNANGRFETVFFKPSKAYRVQDHTDGGQLGDPFTPLVQTSDGRWKVRGAVVVDPERPAYDYREVASFFVDKERQFSPVVDALVETSLGHADRVTLILEAVAFDQGKTLGFHRRTLPLPLLPVRMALETPDPLRKAHTFMQERVSEAQRALRGAVRITLYGEPKARKGDDAEVNKVSAILNRRVDAHYMAELFKGAEEQAEGRTTYQKTWALRVSDWAIRAFEDGVNVLPIPNARRYERLVLPEAYLRGRLRWMREEAGVTDQEPEEEKKRESSEVEVSYGG